MKYLNSEEVSQVLGVTRMQISRMVAKGQLEPINPNHHFKVFKASHVQYVLDKRNLDQQSPQ